LPGSAPALAVASFSVMSVQAAPPATGCAVALVWAVDVVAARGVAATLVAPGEPAVLPSKARTAPKTENSEHTCGMGPVRTVGIEEEFLVFEADAARLADIGPRVVASAGRAAGDEARFEKELKQAQVELASSPAVDLSALADELAQRRTELVRAAAARNARLVASGTCPVADDTATTPTRRYALMAAQFGAVARRQLTCAMHVHVSIDSAEEGVRVLNGIAPWLPVLVALSANSPFHRGRDTEYASYRRLVWGQWPTAGPTAPFADAADYRATVRALIESEAASDEGMIYFDARLSANYPTVEVRVCDICPDLADAVTLAAVVRALVDTVAGATPEIQMRPELLRAAGWRAARWGMSGQLVDSRSGRAALVPAWDLAAALIAEVSAALDTAGDLDRVRQGLEEIRRRGTGADRQRAGVGEGDIARAVDATTLTA